jgi:hypothetical protein
MYHLRTRIISFSSSSRALRPSRPVPAPRPFRDGAQARRPLVPSPFLARSARLKRARNARARGASGIIRVRGHPILINSSAPRMYGKTRSDDELVSSKGYYSMPGPLSIYANQNISMPERGRDLYERRRGSRSTGGRIVSNSL